MLKAVGEYVVNSAAEHEVRHVGLEMRGRNTCENKLSINSCVGTW